MRRADGDTEGALSDLDAAGDIKADAPNIPLMRALILADKGSYEAARTEINRVLSGGRGTASAHYARAAVAFKEGRIDAAEDDADRALELEVEFAAAHMLKGRILEERGKSRPPARASTRRWEPPRILRWPHDAARGERAAVRTRRRRPRVEKRDGDVAEVVLEKKGPLDCKVFLPATGSVVTAKCSE